MPSVLALDFVSKKVSKSPAGSETELYTDLRTDALYKAVGATVLPQFTAAATSATYRTGTFIDDSHTLFSWIRLEGPFSSAVARIYGNGNLFHTTSTITSNRPLRIPAKRHREWAIEITSNGRITDVTMASSAAELL